MGFHLEGNCMATDGSQALYGLRRKIFNAKETISKLTEYIASGKKDTMHPKWAARTLKYWEKRLKELENRLDREQGL